MSKVRGKSIALLVCVVALAACSSNSVSGVPEDSPAPPNGYVLYDGLTEGFRIALPETYVAFGPDELDYEAVLEDVPADVLDGFEAQAAQIFSFGGVLMAFETTEATDAFVENINILKLPTSSIPVDQYLEASVAQLESLGAEVISTEVVAHPDGEAIRMEFQAPSIGSSGANFTILTEDFDWTVTMSTGLTSQLVIDPDVVYDSFRVASG